MKSFIVLLRKGALITRHFLAAKTADEAATAATNRFGGVVLNVLVN